MTAAQRHILGTATAGGGTVSLSDRLIYQVLWEDVYAKCISSVVLNSHPVTGQN